MLITHAVTFSLTTMHCQQCTTPHI